MQARRRCNELRAKHKLKPRFQNYLPALFVVLLAFAFRMHGLEYVRQNYDRAYPHGLGIAIREAVVEGRLAQLPAVSLLASINLPNPAGASYFYALLTAIEPSAYVATALNAMLGALVAAVAFNLARRTFGMWAAVATGLFVATSVWASWVSRGAWLQGPIEAMSALAAWLTINGVANRKPRYLFAAFVVVALCMQTYLVAFGLLAQVVAALIAGGAVQWFGPKVLAAKSAPEVEALVGGAASPGNPAEDSTSASSSVLRRAALAGLVVCALSLFVYVGAAMSVRSPVPGITDATAANSDLRTTGLNLDPINHALRIASGRDFENEFVEHDTAHFALRDRVSDLRATIVDVLMLIGLGMVVVALMRTRKSADGAVAASPPLLAILLAWFALPILGAFLVANYIRPDWKVHVFYLLLISPMPYLLAGAPFALIERAMHDMGRMTQNAIRYPRYALIGVLAQTGIAGVAIPWWNAIGDVEAAIRFPYTHDGPYSLPLKWQMQLATAWREHGCTALNGQEHEAWLASMVGSMKAARSDEFRVKGNSTIWQVQPQGGSCALLVDGTPPPAHADVIPIPIPGQKRADRTPIVMALYRSMPLPQAVQPPEEALTVNLGEGWRLLDLHTPATARPGETIAVTHEWLVGWPPNEPYSGWYFAPFVKLFAPDGRMILQIDNAPAILGYLWRPGDVQISAVRFVLPDDLSPGEYQLEMSLFDPNQKKNAVYFDPQRSDTPIVTIRRELSVQ